LGPNSHFTGKEAEARKGKWLSQVHTFPDYPTVSGSSSPTPNCLKLRPPQLPGSAFCCEVSPWSLHHSFMAQTQPRTGYRHQGPEIQNQRWELTLAHVSYLTLHSSPTWGLVAQVELRAHRIVPCHGKHAGSMFTVPRLPIRPICLVGFL
jgi:hypothetical protein